MAWDKDKARSAYAQKLRDPRWQKMRLKIMERDEFTCQFCFDSESTLNVHHRDYQRGKDPWDYPENWLVTLCETCHRDESESRPDEEKSLLNTLRVKGYTASHLNELLIAFHNSPDAWDPMVSALAWAIESKDVMHAIRERYFEYLKEKTSRREAAGAPQEVK